MRSWGAMAASSCSDYLETRKDIFSFAEPTIIVTQGHIMGPRPPPVEYRPHTTDAGPLAEAEDLTREGFVKLTTTQEAFRVPPSVRQIDAAWALEEFTLPPMLREAVNVLGIRGVVDRSADGRPGREDELSLALACMWPDGLTTPVDPAGLGPDDHVAAPVDSTAAIPGLW